jgi:hypothetical protein
MENRFKGNVDRTGSVRIEFYALKMTKCIRFLRELF